jgi:hypothetical protein
MRICAALILTCLTLGCNRGPEVGTVSGKVTLNGKGLPNARVNFQPVERGTARPGVGSYGTTDANGDYTLTLLDGGKGAIVGKHRVEINVVAEERDDADDRRRPPPQTIPPRYNLHSDLTFDVRPGDNKADWPLKSP